MKFILYNVLSIVLLFVFNSKGFSQAIFAPPSYDKKPRIEATRTDEKIVLDGKLNEPAWRKSQTVSDFIVSFPRQGGHATYQTEVKVLYDDENLYVGAICHLPEAKKKIKVQDMR
ncbi:MAG: hypothetical protein ICV66_04775, partial [Chitinophagaceae bacterium]|nr:hypothetical protein [Chitinophagaceae bacterium]